MMRVSAIVVVVASLAWVGGGCGMDSASRVALYETQLARVETLLDDHGGKIETLQESLDRGLDLLADVNLPAGVRQTIQEGVTATQSALVQAVEYRAKLETWIDQTQTAISDAKAGGAVDISAEVQVIADAAAAAGTAIGGTAGGIVGLVALLVSLTVNIVQRVRGKTATKTLTAIVTGVESADTTAANMVKAAVETKMKAAGVYDAGNALVDQLKG